MSLCAPPKQYASSFSLTATVYGWWAKKPKALRILSITGRIVPITLAVIMIILLQLDFTHVDFMVYMAIANVQCTCLCCLIRNAQKCVADYC